MGNNDIHTLLHKTIKLAPEHGSFPLLILLQGAMNDEQDEDKISRAFGPVKELFLTKYGRPDGSGHPQFFELNDAGRKLKAQPFS